MMNAPRLGGHTGVLWLLDMKTISKNKQTKKIHQKSIPCLYYCSCILNLDWTNK